MSLQLFLEYINGLDEDHRIREPGYVVAQVYHDTQASLIELKQSAQSYMVPGKNSRGQWIPIFDHDRTDEIASLSVEIDQATTNLKAISNDI